jgi:hypothetical protein
MHRLNKTYRWAVVLAGVLVSGVLLAQGGASGFESKVQSMTGSLIKTLLPMMSILGMAYAALLGVQGDPSARKRMTLVVVASLVGFLAPMIVGWLQSIVGG